MKSLLYFGFVLAFGSMVFASTDVSCKGFSPDVDLSKKSFVFQSHEGAGTKPYPKGEYTCQSGFKTRGCPYIKMTFLHFGVDNGAFLRFYSNGWYPKFTSSNNPPEGVSYIKTRSKYSFYAAFENTGVSQPSKNGVKVKLECVQHQANCECGKAQRSSKIVGGQNTEVNEWPWQVALVPRGWSRSNCGGTLVDEKHVVTAAHCTEGKNVGSFDVVLGEHNWQTSSETTSVRKSVKSITNHPNYNSPRRASNDIAVIELQTPVDFTRHPHIRPVCLPNRAPRAGDNVVATGWGALETNGQSPNILQEVSLKILSDDYCNKQYDNLITKDMVCASVSGGEKDTCQGDSGGPLVSNEALGHKDYYELFGVTSWGYECASAVHPGVYAEVFTQKSWLERHIPSSLTCSRPQIVYG